MRTKGAASPHSRRTYYQTLKTKKMAKTTRTKRQTGRKGNKKAKQRHLSIDLTPQEVDTILSERGIRFIDPLSDFGFKRLLGTERNKDITIHLLNSLVGEDVGVISDITFISSEHVGFLPGRHKVRLDIHCLTQDKDHVIIEMQREAQQHFIRRLRVYNSHATASSVSRSDREYKTAPRIFSLCFMEKDMPEFKGRERYFWKVYLKDDDNEIFSKENIWYFVEFSKFAAQFETLDLTDPKDLWLHMLTHVAEVEEETVATMEPVFQSFYEECRISNLNEMEKKEYVTSVLEYDDVKESLQCERAEGHAEGFAEGIEQGIAEGIEQGIEQGRDGERRQLARNMLAEGIAPALVAKITGLTEDEMVELGQ